MIAIGSTPTVSFDYDIAWDATLDVRITFKQNGKVRIVLDSDRITYEDGKLIACLTQEETLSLVSGKMEVQIKAKVNGDNVVPSEILETTILRTIDKEEI